MITQATSPFINSASTKSILFNGKKVTICCALIGAILLSVVATAAEVPLKSIVKRDNSGFIGMKESHF
jgi:hypothetical protein